MITEDRRVVLAPIGDRVYRWQLEGRQWQLRPDPNPPDGAVVQVAPYISPAPCEMWNATQVAIAALKAADKLEEEARNA